MTIIPAIDLKGGRCVRLRQGRADDVTVYGDDPAAQARIWADEGGRELHVVDLDGAFDGEMRHAEAIKAILKDMGIPLLAEDTGENYGRTVQINLENGVYTVKTMVKGEKDI